MEHHFSSLGTRSLKQLALLATLLSVLSPVSTFAQYGNRVRVLSGTATTCDWRLQRICTWSLTGSSTNTHSNVPVGAFWESVFVLSVTSDGTHNLDFVFPGGITTNWVSQFLRTPRNGETEYTFSQIGSTVKISVYPDVFTSTNGTIFGRLDGTNAFALPAAFGISGGGGDTIWDNTTIPGTIQPASGQTTNRLTFISGAADNATNVALVVNSEATWTDGYLAALRNNSTNVLLAGPSGGLFLGRNTPAFWGGPPENNIVQQLNAEGGDPDEQQLYLQSTADLAGTAYAAGIIYVTTNYADFQVTAETAGGTQGILIETGDSYATITFTVDGDDVTVLDPAAGSTGSAVAYLLDTSNVLTNGDAIFALRNAGSDRVKFDHAGTPQIYSTITAGGTTGAQTINKPSGRVNIAAGQSSIVVTDALVTTSSLVFATVASNDATATLKNVVSGSGSFTVTLTATATAETKVNFLVVNPL